MRPAFCILGLLILSTYQLSAQKGGFEFDDLTPITPIQPKVQAAKPAEPKAIPKPDSEKKDQKAIESIQSIAPEPKIKLDISPAPGLSFPKKETKKAIEPMSSLEPKKKETSENLSPEKPFPIKADSPTKETSKDKTSPTPTEPKVSKELPPPRPLGDLSAEEPDSTFTSPSSQSGITLMLMLFATALICLYFWYQKFVRNKMQAHGVDIQVLGQTFLDGQTKIVLLKVGQKVIVMAKSHNFCTTLDIITEPEEINLLTLGSSAAANGEDFSNMLNDFQKQTRPSRAEKKIPNAKEMRSELDQLKKQLGQYQRDVT